MKRFLALASAAALSACVSVQTTASLSHVPATSAGLACVRAQATALGYTVHGSDADLRAERAGTSDRLTVTPSTSGLYQVRAESSYQPKTPEGTATRRRVALDAATIEANCAAAR
ncbi:MAG TPA: hypothetical protein VFE05_17770 [Longimicrobiaceae bacterium]|jgi:hypothetical protein|nr:hypothetical protein [Longimicrobiaceae bacterium]